MESDREQAVRQRAYELWEQEGRPDGKDFEHWLRAEAEILHSIYAGVTNNGKRITRSSIEPVRRPRRRSKSAG